MVKVLTFERGDERIALYERPSGEQLAICHVREYDDYVGEPRERVVAIWSSSAGVALNRATTC